MSDLGDISEGMRQLTHVYATWAKELLQTASVRIGARATSTFMRNAGKGAGPRSPGDTGPLRIVTGRLARSLSGARTGRAAPESIASIEAISATAVRLIKGSAVPYAKAHEEGYRGPMRVPTHQRRISQAFGRPIAPVVVTVKAHTRQGTIPKRPYLAPALEKELPALQSLAADRLIELIEEVALS